MNRELNIHESNDLTSMVDVTFLLLIFFVITASFVSVKAMQTEPEKDPGTVVELTENPALRVVVDEHNQVFVGVAGYEEFTSTPRELRDAIRDARDSRGAETILIDAHENSRHRSVVEVCDAGRAVGINQIRVNPYK